MRHDSLIVFCLCVCSLFANAQSESLEKNSHHCFFHPNSLVGGLGATYSGEFQTVGFNSRVYYNITEQLCLGSEFSFLKSGKEELKEVNFVAHYIFETRFIGIYPLAGVNFSHEKKAETDSDWGFKGGVGVHRNVKKFNIYAEFSITESDLRDRFVTLGFLYMF